MRIPKPVLMWGGAMLLIFVFLLYLTGQLSSAGASTTSAPGGIVGKDLVEVEALRKELGEQQARIDELNNEVWKLKNINGPWKSLFSAGETSPGAEIVNSMKELTTTLKELKDATKKEEEPAKVEKEPPAPARVDTNLYQVLSQRLVSDSSSKINALRWLREKSKENPELVSSEVAKLLIGLLSDQEKLVQGEAEALLLEAGRKDSKAVQKELVSYMLDEKDEKKAEKSALLLIKIGESSVPELTEALGTADKEKLKRIGWCLIKIGPGAIQSLQEVYESGSAGASMDAHELLQAIPPQ